MCKSGGWVDGKPSRNKLRSTRTNDVKEDIHSKSYQLLLARLRCNCPFVTQTAFIYFIYTRRRQSCLQNIESTCLLAAGADIARRLVETSSRVGLERRWWPWKEDCCNGRLTLLTPRMEAHCCLRTANDLKVLLRFPSFQVSLALSLLSTTTIDSPDDGWPVFKTPERRRWPLDPAAAVAQGPSPASAQRMQQ